MPDDALLAYSQRAAEYVALLGSMDAVHDDDRALITRWATELDGPVLDAGCGPGHWTAHLQGLGVDVEGLDQVSDFLRHARKAHPDTRFRLGTLQAPGVPPGSLAGVLAWYSLIHLPPPELPDVLAGFRAALAPGGGLVVGFCRGERLEPFAHKVTEAWFWPPDELAGRLEEAGFAVLEKHRRDDAGQRPHGALVARRA
ncbi:class I SAM-dependent methyltransferase [Spongisporangium articulatum]|uniref:Class I SAM-dependent methyltransferase n=1 Tax=Spongisporangium articulatum TaxID=3362603 RepID=A0ABW8ARQ0_9ACTN